MELIHKNHVESDLGDSLTILGDITTHSPNLSPLVKKNHLTYLLPSMVTTNEIMTMMKRIWLMMVDNMTNLKVNFLVETLNIGVTHELEISHCF